MSESKAQAKRIEEDLRLRFGQDFPVDPAWPGLDEIARIAAHRSHRAYSDRPVDDGLLDVLLACALSAPSKSDLQQADIVVVREPALRGAIADLIPSMPWLRAAPALLVFCGNGRRLPQMAAWRGKPFPNDHLDAFFNATVDASIVMTTFLRAATATGLSCCPISVIRNHAAAVSGLLALPPRVFPLAGLTVGYPAQDQSIGPRLPLSITLHRDRYSEDGLDSDLEAYDRRRAALQPLARQRNVEAFGTVEPYGWSEDKARQYAAVQRADFGAFIRAKGFCLD